MYVPDKLKLNKFRMVAIPDPKDYFIRFGKNVPGNQQYTGDQVAPMPKSKVDTLADMARFDASQSRHEQQMLDYEAYAASQAQGGE